MINRKILYGYQIQYGEIAIVPQEAEMVRRIAAMYLDGSSYQRISDILNQERVPFSAEVPLWNKHKVKRLVENPRYTGADGYPAIIEREVFDTIQKIIQEKTSHYTRAEKRPVQQFREYLQCGACCGRLLGTGGSGHRKDTLYLRCECCGMQVIIPDAELMDAVSRQMAEHCVHTAKSYIPSADTVRLTNAINRGLEHPDNPENIVSLILQGVSARYDCCPAPGQTDTGLRPAEADLKRFGQAVSHITITGENAVKVYFK